MPRGTAIALLLWVGCGVALKAGGKDATKDEEAFFEAKVRPVLATHCVECHGPTKASAGLRLDSREGVFRGGESGPAIVPGDLEKSLLAIAIKHDENEFVQ